MREFNTAGPIIPEDRAGPRLVRRPRRGHLVVFDRAGGKSWDDKVFRREEDAGGTRITVWGM